MLCEIAHDVQGIKMWSTGESRAEKCKHTFVNVHRFDDKLPNSLLVPLVP